MESKFTTRRLPQPDIGPYITGLRASADPETMQAWAERLLEALEESRPARDRLFKTTEARRVREVVPASFAAEDLSETEWEALLVFSDLAVGVYAAALKPLEALLSDCEHALSYARHRPEEAALTLVRGQIAQEVASLRREFDRQRAPREMYAREMRERADRERARLSRRQKGGA